jgi:hypothetical protein
MEINDKNLWHIRYLKSIIVDLAFETSLTFFCRSDTELCRCYNGIGPERFGDAVLKISTKILAFFEAVALVHDEQCTYSDKSKKGFIESNKMFLRNCKRLIRTISWTHFIQRWVYSKVARLLFKILKRYGWKSWVE